MSTPAFVPCRVCGQTTLMTGTALCHGCCEIVSRIKHGYVVMNQKSGGFCYFHQLDNALEFYNDGVARKEPYVLYAILKTSNNQI